jgi:hypothetical protein
LKGAIIPKEILMKAAAEKSISPKAVPSAVCTLVLLAAFSSACQGQQGGPMGYMFLHAGAAEKARINAESANLLKAACEYRSAFCMAGITPGH